MASIRKSIATRARSRFGLSPTRGHFSRWMSSRPVSSSYPGRSRTAPDSRRVGAVTMPRRAGNDQEPRADRVVAIHPAGSPWTHFPDRPSYFSTLAARAINSVRLAASICPMMADPRARSIRATCIGAWMTRTKSPARW